VCKKPAAAGKRVVDAAADSGEGPAHAVEIPQGPVCQKPAAAGKRVVDAAADSGEGPAHAVEIPQERV
jgi:hypothetical protein